MAFYHAYKVINFERSESPIEIEADSDAEAIRKAEPYVNGADILLWEGTRFIITLKRQKMD
jgi:hypothetical protein